MSYPQINGLDGPFYENGRWIYYDPRSRTKLDAEAVLRRMPPPQSGYPPDGNPGYPPPYGGNYQSPGGYPPPPPQSGYPPQGHMDYGYAPQAPYPPQDRTTRPPTSGNDGLFRHTNRPAPEPSPYNFTGERPPKKPAPEKPSGDPGTWVIGEATLNPYKEINPPKVVLAHHTKKDTVVPLMNGLGIYDYFLIPLKEITKMNRGDHVAVAPQTDIKKVADIVEEDSRIPVQDIKGQIVLVDDSYVADTLSKVHITGQVLVKKHKKNILFSTETLNTFGEVGTNGKLAESLIMACDDGNFLDRYLDYRLKIKEAYPSLYREIERTLTKVALDVIDYLTNSQTTFTDTFVEDRHDLRVELNEEGLLEEFDELMNALVKERIQISIADSIVGEEKIEVIAMERSVPVLYAPHINTRGDLSVGQVTKKADPDLRDLLSNAYDLRRAKKGHIFYSYFIDRFGVIYEILNTDTSVAGMTKSFISEIID